MTVEPSPLLASSPDTLTALFEADPTTLTDASLTTLVRELRRRRDAFAAQEAADASKGKGSRTKPGTIPAAVAAALDKPVGEVSIDDLDL